MRRDFGVLCWKRLQVESWLLSSWFILILRWPSFHCAPHSHIPPPQSSHQHPASQRSACGEGGSAGDRQLWGQMIPVQVLSFRAWPWAWFCAVCSLHPESLGGRSPEEKTWVCLPRREHMCALWGPPAPRTSLALTVQLASGGGGRPSVNTQRCTRTCGHQLHARSHTRPCHFFPDV